MNDSELRKKSTQFHIAAAFAQKISFEPNKSKVAEQFREEARKQMFAATERARDGFLDGDDMIGLVFDASVVAFGMQPNKPVDDQLEELTAIRLWVQTGKAQKLTKAKLEQTRHLMDAARWVREIGASVRHEQASCVLTHIPWRYVPKKPRKKIKAKPHVVSVGFRAGGASELMRRGCWHVFQRSGLVSQHRLGYPLMSPNASNGAFERVVV